MSTIGTHAIKVRWPDMKRWEFLTPDGGCSNLRVHAATSSHARCEYLAAKIEAENGGVQTRVVEL